MDGEDDFDNERYSVGSDIVLVTGACGLGIPMHAVAHPLQNTLQMTFAIFLCGVLRSETNLDSEECQHRVLLLKRRVQ